MVQFRGRNRNNRSRRRPYYAVQENRQEIKRTKKLDMRRNDEFQYLLSQTVNTLPESVRGAIKGSIYSIASKRGVKEAKEFIQKKNQEGIISSDMGRELIELVFHYSKYQ